jgi:hypothetical protein
MESLNDILRKLPFAIFILLFIRVWIPSTKEVQATAAAIWIIYTVIWFFVWCLAGEAKEWIVDPDRSPQNVYEEYVNRYYTSQTDKQFDIHEILLPSPYMYQNRKSQLIWSQPGFWQDQWRLYLNSQPSVYNGKIPLPRPYNDMYRPMYGLRIWFVNERKTETTVPIN